VGDLARLVNAKLGIDPGLPLRCSVDLKSKVYGTQIELGEAVTSSIWLLFELESPDPSLIPTILANASFKKIAYPKGESHLTLLKDEIKIEKVADFLAMVKHVAPMEFQVFGKSDTFTLTLAKDLQFDQVVECVARHLEADPQQTIIMRHSSVLIPARSAVYRDFRALRHRQEQVYCEVAPVDMRVSVRVDVTIIEQGNPERTERFGLYLMRGAEAVRDVNNRLTEKIGSSDYLLFYLREFIPSAIITDDDEPINLQSRVVCQLGTFHIEDEEKEMLIRVLYCDEFLYPWKSDLNVPCLAKIPRPILWKDLKEMFPNVESLYLVRRAKRYLQRIGIEDDGVVDGSRSEMVAVIHKLQLEQMLFHGASPGPMRMKKEFGQRDDSAEGGEEEEENGEEEEEGIEDPE
jgi:hypothetical protein